MGQARIGKVTLKNGGAEVFWTIRGNSQGAATSMLALAQAALQRQIVDPD